MTLEPMGYYIPLKDGRVEKAPEDFNLTNWKEAHQEEWIVASDRPRGSTGPWISTVFLFSPHYDMVSPIPCALWETIIFWREHPGLDQALWRYTSLQAAQEGHRKALAWVEAAMEPYEVA